MTVNYRFLTAANVATDIHVVSSSRLNEVDREIDLLQPPHSEEAFVTGQDRDKIIDFEITLLLKGEGTTDDTKADDVFSKIASLTEAATTAAFLQRYIDGVADTAYRALWGDKRSLGGRRLTPINPQATDWQMTLILRPKFPRWTLDKADASTEYNTGFTTLSILGGAGPTADAGIFTDEFSTEFA